MGCERALNYGPGGIYDILLFFKPLWGEYHCLHSTDEETAAQRG